MPYPAAVQHAMRTASGEMKKYMSCAYAVSPMRIAPAYKYAGRSIPLSMAYTAMGSRQTAAHAPHVILAESTKYGQSA